MKKQTYRGGMFAKRAAFLLLSTVLIAPALLGCSTKSGATYTPDEAGAVMDVSRASVTRSREVTIEGLNGDQAVGWGTVIGATVAGAGVYGLTKADSPLGVAVTIIAAIGGALAGTVIEEQTNKRQGAEYILDQKDGKPFAVVQTLTSGEEIIPAGTNVLIIHGKKGFIRVVPDK